MIYLKNNTETQSIYIPRQTVLGGGYIATTKTYEDGLAEGIERGKEIQKGQLLNLYVTENGEYEREDGWGAITVNIPREECPDCPEGGSCNLGIGEYGFDSNSVGDYELYASDDGYDGWSKMFIHIYGDDGAISVRRASGLLDDFANNIEVLDFGWNYYVGGIITEIQEIYTLNGEYLGYATYILDNGFKIYRGKWISGNDFNSKDQIKLGAYVIVFGRLQNNNGGLGLEEGSQVVAYQECGGGSCNLGIGEYSFDASDEGNYELYAENDDYDGWSKMLINIYSGAITVHKAANLLNGYDVVEFGGKYYVGGEITEIQEVIEDCYKTYVLDNGLKIYKGGWFDGFCFNDYDEPIKVGSYVIVYGVIQDNNGELRIEEGSQVIAYQECAGGEGGSCNLEDKSVTPSMSDRDGNGLIVVNPSEGYNGLSRTVINPQTIYNEGVEAGRTEGEASLAAKARVLNVTENGVYKSKFSDPIIPANYTVTGVYADGTNFYSYAELNGKVFNTNIPATKDSRIEFWWKNDATYTRYAAIIGGQTEEGHIFKFAEYSRNMYRIEYGNHISGILFTYEFDYDMTSRWNHIIFSKQDGLYVNDELICNVQGEAWAENETIPNFWINAAYLGEIDNNANGTFGMIKIDSTIIIPTANGFKNVNTGELLEVVQDGTYTFTENLPIYSEGELYKTINVNVPTVQEQSFDYDTTAFTYKVYDWTSVNINRDNMTNDCNNRPLDCLLLRNRNGECTVMTKLDTCSGVVRLENGWNGDSVILSLKSNTITKFSSNSINSNRLTSIDTGFAQLEGNAITNCNALTDIKVTVVNNDLSNKFATNCFNGLPAVGTITIRKSGSSVTLTDDEITSFFRTIVGEGWTITIE